MSIGVATYSIVVNVALIVEATEGYFVYFVASELMFLASNYMLCIVSQI